MAPPRGNLVPRRARAGVLVRCLPSVGSRPLRSDVGLNTRGEIGEFLAYAHGVRGLGRRGIDLAEPLRQGFKCVGGSTTRFDERHAVAPLSPFHDQLELGRADEQLARETDGIAGDLTVLLSPEHLLAAWEQHLSRRELRSRPPVVLHELVREVERRRIA